MTKNQERAVERAKNMADKIKPGKVYTTNQIMKLWKLKYSKTANDWIRKLEILGVMNYFTHRSVPRKGERATKCTYTFERKT